MTIFEETDEFAFVQHAVNILGVENSRPDLEPGGLWIRGPLRLSWGLRTATEPPTIQIGRSPFVLNSLIAALPYDLPGRLAVWRTAFANRESSIYPDLSSLNFRDTVALTAILSWNPPSDEPI
jgi:hypothetical protein